MYKEFYSTLEGSLLPILGLIFFLVAFVLVLLRTFAHKHSNDFDAVAALPLHDGTSTVTSEVKP